MNEEYLKHKMMNEGNIFERWTSHLLPNMMDKVYLVKWAGDWLNFESLSTFIYVCIFSFISWNVPNTICKGYELSLATNITTLLFTSTKFVYEKRLFDLKLSVQIRVTLLLLPISGSKRGKLIPSEFQALKCFGFISDSRSFWSRIFRWIETRASVFNGCKVEEICFVSLIMKGEGITFEGDCLSCKLRRKSKLDQKWFMQSQLLSLPTFHRLVNPGIWVNFSIQKFFSSGYHFHS